MRKNHPHNFFLDILNDLGLIGFLVLIIPVCKILLSNYRSYKFNLLENEKNFKLGSALINFSNFNSFFFHLKVLSSFSQLLIQLIHSLF